MWESERVVCPLPHLGFCIFERCNFWDWERQECSGLWQERAGFTDDPSSPLFAAPCEIPWTEDPD